MQRTHPDDRPAASFTLVQLTDTHIGAPWIDDPSGALAAAIASVRRVLGRPPDAVAVTGDIANTPDDAEYVQARALLDELGAPLYVLPGNHDDRDGLRRHFDGVPSGGLVNYTADLGPLRLIALDTKRDGSDAGQLDAERLAWLAATLEQDPQTPTLIALHHPPLVSGLAPMDAIGIPADERAALGELVALHPQVQLIAGGHIHRTIVGALGGVPVLSLASTAAQLKLDFSATEMSFVEDEPPCFAVHRLVDGRLATHIQPVRIS